ncbi:MAG TPA: hypothetical protein DCQ97_10695 [Chitinophagaceae bacterium]|nr:hypothetical protein [Chitinophagaceae bacterium]
MKAVASFLFFLFIPNFSIAQTPGLSIELISTEQGLPDKRVNCITQDNNGFMWVGTANGIFRYDGYVFEDFTRQITGSNQLKGVNINALEKDKAGNLWIGYNNGLAVMDPISGRVELKKLTAYSNPDRLVRRILFDNKGRVVLYVANGSILCYNEKMELQFAYRFSIAEKAAIDEHPLILQDTDNSFWLPTFYDGIDHISADGKFIEHYRQVLHPQRSNTLKTFINTAGVLVQFYLDKPYNSIIPHKQLKHLARDSAAIRSYVSPAAFYDRSGNTWKIQIQTITLQDTIAKRKIIFRLPYKGDFLSDHPFLNIFQSSDNTIWTCSRKGLFKIHYKRSPFINYLSNPYYPSQPGISIRGIEEDKKGNTWVGYYAYTHAGTKSNLAVIQKGSKEAIPYTLVNPNRQPYDVGVSCILNMFINEETILATSVNQYIHRINIKSHVVVNDSLTDENRIPVKPLIYRNDSTVFLASDASVFMYNPLATGSRAFKDVHLNNRNELLSGVNDFFDAGNGYFWAAGNPGLYLLDNTGKIIRSYTDGKNSSIVLPVLDINFLHRDPKGILWLGTRHGLLKLDTARKMTRVFTTQDGLPNNNVMSILPDEFGYLWLSTDNGLSRYNPAQNIFINYDINDELPHNEFNRMAYLKASDGRLYFGGLNGVTAVYPKEVDTSLSNLQPQLVSYTKYAGQTDSVLTFSAASVAGNSLTFDHNDKLFSFHFMLPAFRSAVKNRFLYKLDGWDKEWQTAAGSNIIQYSFLPAGNYTLKVKGAAAGDTWSRQEYRLRITVLQAWYRTWWFYSLMTLLTATLIYLLYRYRINQVLKVQQIRNKISADLHDELGSVLTQISLQSDMVSSNIYNEEEKQKELTNISNTSRQAIHAMSDIVWSVKAGHDKNSSLIDRMKDHADLMLQPVGAVITFTVTGINENKEIDNHLRQELFLIFKEAIHNIVKHSSPTQVDIRMENSKSHFKLTIQNDINQQKENTILGGNGLENMQRRAKTINALVETKKEGNHFTVFLNRQRI